MIDLNRVDSNSHVRERRETGGRGGGGETTKDAKGAKWGKEGREPENESELMNSGKNSREDNHE